MVVWEGRISDYDEQGVIQARRFAWDGTSALPPVAVAPTNLGSGTDCTPRVAADATGRTLIVWQDKLNGSESDILARAYDANGKAERAAVRVNAHIGGVQQGPRVIAAASGGYIVGWTGQQGTSSDAGFFFRRVP